MKIGILKKKYYGATDWYRLSPWGYLARQTKAEFFGFDPKVNNQYDLAGIDLLVCHSPATMNEQRIILSASRHGVKIVFDYDDLVFDVDEINPANRFWGREDNQANAIELMMVADAITVSTRALQEQFKERFRIETTFIPNAFNDFTRRLWPRTKKRNPALILWRGSNTHEGDLFSHRDAFIPLRNTEYLFFGYKSEKFNKRYGGHLDHLPFQQGESMIEFYFDRLRNIAPTYVVVPLENTSFNRCKSNIAWQEATWAGAITIAPGYMPEFKGVPCIHYETVDNLRNIFQAIDKGYNYSEVLTAAREDMELRWLLSSINDKRLALVNELFAPAPVGETAREGGATFKR